MRGHGCAARRPTSSTQRRPPRAAHGAGAGGKAGGGRRAAAALQAAGERGRALRGEEELRSRCGRERGRARLDHRLQALHIDLHLRAPRQDRLAFARSSRLQVYRD